MKTKLIVLFLICLSFNSFADGKLKLLTDEQINLSIKSREKLLIERLKNYHLLFLPGLATDITEDIGEFTGALSLTHESGFLASFYGQMDWARTNGISISMSRLNRLGSCDENGKFIINEIEKINRPIIIISQSKSGVDFIHGLLSEKGRSSAIRNKIKAWLAFQPPFAGSPLADIVQNNWPLDKSTAVLVNILKGNANTYRQMSMKYRSNFNYYYSDDINEIQNDIPITTFVSSEKPSTLSNYFEAPTQAALLSPLVNLINQKYNLLNDGIAIVKGTCLDQANCYFKYNVDHFAAVMDTYPFKGPSVSERLTMFQFLLNKTLENSH